jgi:hypothetical protein
MAETTNFTSLQATAGYVGDVTGNLVGDTTGTHTGDVKTSSIQDLQGTEQIGVSASGINVVSNLTVGGNLTVLGGETILDVQKLEVEDYNIVIGKNNETSGVLNGSGITLHGGTGTDITFQYGSNGYMYLSNKLQVVEEVKTQTITADAADITDLRATLTGDVTGNVTGQVSDISNHSTTDLTEGNNLYWTPARSDARIALQTGANLDLSQKTTSELSEGVNLYYTEARVDANIASKSTDDLAEGSNLYFTDARVRANRLDQMAAPTASVSLNSQTITDLAEPQAISDAATKQYVDNAVSSKDELSELGGTTDDLTEGSTNLFLTPNAQTIDGNKTLTGATVVSGSLTVPTPTGGTQAANKDYVDNAIASIDELSELLGSTDDVQEGSTNLYYTDARVHAAISAGTGVTYDGSGEFSIGQPVGTSDNVSFGKVYVRTGTGVGVDLNSQTNNAALRFHTSAGQTGIISTTSGNAPVQVYASLLWARAINGGTGNLMADGDVTVGGDLSVTGTISSPTITALEASISGDVTALQAELDATQTGAGLNADGTYTANAGANYIASSSSLQDADNDLDTALKAEEASRQAADSTLQSNIDAEEAARIAADSTLQSNIDSEEAARIAGDASTLSSANSYTDTEIANLVDSAPTTLDTLNEIATALGNDPNLATTLTNQIAGVQSNLDAEIATTDAEVTALQAADVTLQSNIDSEAATRASADTTLQSNIDTVAANLATEISATDAEVTALQAADVTLQSNIDAEETARQSADTTLQSNIDSEASTRAAADTTLQSNIDTVASDLASEISTTDAEIAALQATDSAEASARAAADATLQSNIDTEEAARISGDAATLAAAKAYSDSLDHDTAQLEADVAQLQTDLTAETSNRTSADTTLQSNIDTVQSNLDAEIADRDLYFVNESNTTKVLNPLRSSSVTIGNNIGITPAAGFATQFNRNVEFDNNSVISKGGVTLTPTFAELNFVDGVTSNIQTQLDGLSSDITSEESARTAADTTLQSNIDTVATNLSNEISTTNSEISALQSADTTLQSNIDTEEAARIAGDASTLSSAQSYTDTAVANLIDSAPAALDTLNELAAALGDDANFATTVTNQIAAVQADVDQNEADADAAIALKLNTADFGTNFDSNLAGKTTDNVTEGSTNLYFTDARSRSAISVSGDLAYNSTTGVISFTERTDAEVNSLADARIALNTGANLDLSGKSTTDLSEGTNLYYTDARVDARIALQTGANLDLSSKTTDNLGEGASNLYYKDSRARGAISVSGDLAYNSTTGVISFTERTDAQVNGLADARIAAASIDDLSDVTVSALATDGDLLRYNKSTGIWENVEIVGTTNIEVEHTAGTITVKHGTSHISKTYDNADNGTATNAIPLNRAEVIMDIAGTATNDVYLNIAQGTEGQEIVLVIDPAITSFYNIYLADSGAASNATNMYGTLSLGSYNRTAVLRYCDSIGLWVLVGGEAFVSH